MATTTSTIEIWINKDVQNIIRAKQMDSNSRFLQVALMEDDGTPYDLTDHTATFNALKSDLTHVFNDCVMTDPANGIITVELTDQTLAIGNSRVVADITVFNSDGTEVLTTRTFDIEVQTTVRDDSAIESSNEFGAVITLFQDVWDLRDRIIRMDELMGELDDDIPEGGDQASTVSFMGALNRVYNMMLSQSIIGLDVVIYAQTVLQNVNTDSAAWAFEIANRQGKLGMLIDTILNLGDADLQELAMWADVLADATAFDYIVNDEAAMSAAAANNTAFAIIIADDAMMSAVAASSAAMSAIAASAKALNAIVKSDNASLFNGSAYIGDVFDAMLASCADTEYFTRYPVAELTNATTTNWYRHALSSNLWTSSATQGDYAAQNAIYFIKTTRINYNSGLSTTLNAIDNSGTATPLVSNDTSGAAKTYNLCAINNLSIYRPWFTPAWTASADSTAGEAFMAI